MTVARFEVLGPLRVSLDGCEVELGSAKRRDLLAFLLLRAGSTVTRAEIVDALWGAEPPPSATNLVQTYVKGLRQALGPLRDRLVTVGSGYRFDVSPEEFDLFRFRVSKDLREWQGRCLADRSEELRAHPWVTAVEAERVAVALTVAEPDAILPVLRELAELEPLHEGVHAQLVLALAVSGMQAEAVAVYQRIRRRLADELGVDPGPQLRLAYERMLRQDLPVRRTTDWSAPAQLPRDVTDFTGRPEQLAELLARLDGPQRGAVVVSAIGGRGGVGKSALAVHAAHRSTGRYPDGQLYANLRGAQPEPADPAVVLAGFLRALGVDGSAIPEELDERVTMFRSRLVGRRVLILLDDAANEAQVRPLLPGSAAGAVLVTSRAGLGALEGAATLDLDVFQPEEAVGLLSHIAGAERVALELDQAHRIVRQCGHLPLAVRIAAARLAARPTWTLEHLAGRLSDERRRLDELAIGDLAVSSSLSLSYSGLAEEAQRLFRRLGLLEAPDFAAWVAAPLLDDTLERGSRLIEVLVEARLLDEIGLDATGQMRYRFHDLVRLYARGRAEEESHETRKAALARALGAWLALVEEADRSHPYLEYETILGTSERFPLELVGQPRDWFTTERANLVLAADQACAIGMDELAWELATVPYSLSGLEGLSQVSESWLKGIYEICVRTGNRLGQAVLARNLADLATLSGGSDRSIRLAEISRGLFHELGVPHGEVDAMGCKAEMLTTQGHLDEAMALTRERLDLATRSGYTHGRFFALRSRGGQHFFRGDLDSADADWAQAGAIAEAAGDVANRANTLDMRGIVGREQGRFEDAERLHLEALALTRRAGHRRYEITSLRALGALYTKWERPEAGSVLEKALERSRDLHDRFNVSVCLRLLSAVRRGEGRWEEALALIEESEAISRQRRDVQALVHALIEAGHVRAALGDRRRAVELWEEGRDIFRKLGNHGKADEIDALIG